MSDPLAYDPHNVHMRGREWVMTLIDEIAYADLLRDAYPGVRFIDCPVNPRGEAPPNIRPLRSIQECLQPTVNIVFDPGWSPQWTPGYYPGWWSMERMPLPNGTIDRGNIRLSRDGPWRVDQDQRDTVDGGRIYFRMAPGDKGHEAVVRKALRLLAKVASNRNLNIVWVPSLKLRSTDVRNGPWIGHDARRWCLEKPNRTLGGMWQPGGAWAYRPVV